MSRNFKIEAMYGRSRASVKVERGSTCAWHIASISVTHVNFKCVRTEELRDMDFHCRVNFTRVKKNRDNVLKVEHTRKRLTSLNFYFYAWPSIHGFYFIYAHKIYVRTHVKITRQWKSTCTRRKIYARK